MNPLILQEDQERVLAATRSLWAEARGASFFITGGTGFFGKSILESFLHANDKLGLGAKALVLSRDPEKFLKQYPQFVQPTLKFLKGDVRDFEFPNEKFQYVLHAATEASVTLNLNSPAVMFDTVVEGTRRVLDFSVKCGAKKVLLTSSGAVYGCQDPAMSHVYESYLGAPDTLVPGGAYGEGKRTAELLCALYAAQYGFEVKIARCFAFVGPHLPQDVHFAVGNFIRDVLVGKSIDIQGDGTTYRSYLYSSDLMIWLWTILFKGRSARAYNVGSEKAVSIRELAEAVVKACGSKAGFQVHGKSVQGKPAERYVPSVKRAEEELGLKQTVDLEEAIRRTFEYHR